MTSLRPNYRRAREIKAEIDQLAIDKQSAEHAGEIEVADAVREDMDALRHELFLTGVTSEYDL